MLARRLATIDVLSGGRLRVGLGLGWSADEYVATGASFKNRGRRADEFIRVLKAVWTTDPVEVGGEFYQIPRSFVGPKPIQKPHPPIYLAAYAPGALERVARLSDGWNPAGLPIEAMAAMMAEIRRRAEAAGRDPTSLELIVRANLYLSPTRLGDGRYVFTGSLDEIAQDIDAVRGLSAAELIFELNFSPDSRTVAGLFERVERLFALAGGRAPAAAG